jgi:Cdc6-like AAA superfamily ATPase
LSQLTQDTFSQYLVPYFTGHIFKNNSFYVPVSNYETDLYNWPVLRKKRSQVDLDWKSATEIWPFDSKSPEYMNENATVDHQQYAAIKHAICYPFTLVNGDPGTGKTHFSKELIKLIILADILQGPLFIICLKNHALDSLLESILEFTNTTEVVREGGISNSTNQKLQEISQINYMVKNQGGSYLKKSSIAAKEAKIKLQNFRILSLVCYQFIQSGMNDLKMIFYFWKWFSAIFKYQ